GDVVARRHSSALIALAALTLLAPHAYAQPAASPSATCVPGADLLLINGRIHTMDSEDRIVSAVHILGDKFAAVGGSPQPTACTETIDLGGRTVVPGLIDNHNHIVLLGLRPGHDTRLDRKSTRLNSSHVKISYAVFCLKRKTRLRRT